MLKLKEKQEQESEEERGAELLLRKVRKFAKKAWKNWKFVLVCAVVIVVAIAVIMVTVNLNRKDEVVEEIPSEPEIEVSSALEKMIFKNKMTTFLSVYDGIVTVKDDGGKVKYHVAYEAVVKTGIDFSKVDLTFDEENKKQIHIVVPVATINEINVDHKSLDFMFQNEKHNTPETVAEAYGLCQNDALSECANQKAIFKLAKQNAGNVLKAMVEPIVKQIDAEYSVVID